MVNYSLKEVSALAIAIQPALKDIILQRDAMLALEQHTGENLCAQSIVYYSVNAKPNAFSILGVKSGTYRYTSGGLWMSKIFPLLPSNMIDVIHQDPSYSRVFGHGNSLKQEIASKIDGLELFTREQQFTPNDDLYRQLSSSIAHTIAYRLESITLFERMKWVLQRFLKVIKIG